jgi:hypothetical protein
MGSMLMNMAGNILGLGNAATPLRLRAMRDLERLNPQSGSSRRGTPSRRACWRISPEVGGVGHHLSRGVLAAHLLLLLVIVIVPAFSGWQNRLRAGA